MPNFVFMKRKDAILDHARMLFNELGFNAISLKAIAKKMDISYGNVTYHFPKKDAILLQLYLNMRKEHLLISKQFSSSGNLLQDIILAPNSTFDISFHYRFLFIEFAEIMRNHPIISEQQKNINSKTIESLLPIFELLKKNEFIRSEINQKQLRYLMQISGETRTFFFMNNPIINPKEEELFQLKKDYLLHVNQLLLPYLTPKGILIYNQTLNL